MKTIHQSLILKSCLLTIPLVLGACTPEKVRQYRVAKSKENTVIPVSNSESENQVPFTYRLPTGWKTQPATGMRTLSLSTPDGGDVSVVPLPGVAGNLKDNLNRWRGQVGLPPLQDESAIQQSFQPLQIKQDQVLLLELLAPPHQPDKGMQVALWPRKGITWFFKLTGSRQVVKAHKAAFLSFLQSVEFKTEEKLTEQPVASADSLKPEMTAPISPQTTDTRLSYTLPASWKEIPPTSLRVASFEVKANGQVGDVSIVNLAGDGGGLLNNTNRWRRQLEMAPTDEAGLKNLVKDIRVDGHPGYFLALYTGLQGQGMLVALIKQGDQTWYIKMTAPSQLAHQQEKDFLRFVESIRFHPKGKHS